jgi:hypothetical protein
LPAPAVLFAAKAMTARMMLLLLLLALQLLLM